MLTIGAGHSSQGVLGRSEEAVMQPSGEDCAKRKGPSTWRYDGGWRARSCMDPNMLGLRPTDWRFPNVSWKAFEGFSSEEWEVLAFQRDDSDCCA